jgi:hypothetical protein
MRDETSLAASLILHPYEICIIPLDGALHLKKLPPEPGLACPRLGLDDLTA